MKTAVRTFPAHISAHGRRSGPGHTYPLYDLISASGLTVSILPLGASLQKISVTDTDGTELPIALSFLGIQPYEDLVCYAAPPWDPTPDGSGMPSFPSWEPNTFYPETTTAASSTAAVTVSHPCSGM